MKKEQLNKLIEEKNKAFKILSRQDKIKQIANDALTQLKLKKIVPKSMTWVSIPNDIAQKFEPKSSVQAILLDKTQRVICDCCALGGLLLGVVCNMNGMEVHSVKHDECFTMLAEDDLTPQDTELIKLFGKKTLLSIEYIFELGEGSSHTGELTGKFQNYIGENDYNFFDDTEWEEKPPEYRFKKIMNYLAEHGKFDPIDFCKKYVVKKQKKGLTRRGTCGRVDYDRYD